MEKQKKNNSYLAKYNQKYFKAKLIFYGKITKDQVQYLKSMFDNNKNLNKSLKIEKKVNQIFEIEGEYSLKCNIKNHSCKKKNCHSFVLEFLKKGCQDAYNLYEKMSSNLFVNIIKL